MPAFERAKTVHAFDRAATVIGCDGQTSFEITILLEAAAGNFVLI
jgi:limonene-1,2-epoxide hydrolase